MLERGKETPLSIFCFRQSNPDKGKNKGKSVQKTFKTPKFLGIPGFVDLLSASLVVEMAGIEPASEGGAPGLSTGVASVLRFPPPGAQKHAPGIGSLPGHGKGRRRPPRSRSPLIDALIPAAVLRVRTAAYLSSNSNKVVVV